MSFTITTQNIRNSELITENDYPRYRVETPFKLGSRHSTIYRNDQHAQSTIIAEIDWHTFTQSEVSIGGAAIKSNDFLRGGNFSLDRTFTASDGKEYQWKLGFTTKLVTVTQPHVEVAHYKADNILKGRKRQLIVMPEGQHILDSIIISFVIIQKQKEDMRNADPAVAVGSY